MINESLVNALTYVDPDLPIGSYEYFVIAVYYFGESSASEPAFTLITGTNQLDATLFSILPNPARDYVNVQAGYTIISYELLNNSGQVVRIDVVNAPVLNIDVSSFDSGIYYLKLNTTKGASMNKIAIRK
ncbi:MAG: T9SS type A sorting domain-containing protein [Bacteroidales bacterium]